MLNVTKKVNDSAISAKKYIKDAIDELKIIEKMISAKSYIDDAIDEISLLLKCGNEDKICHYNKQTLEFHKSILNNALKGITKIIEKKSMIIE